MPIFNQTAFVLRALDSLLAQTLPDWELVLVDDGSTDGVVEVVRPFLGDRRIRYRRLPENAGLGAALNAGLLEARGSLIAYLPADDVYYPDHLARLAGCLQGVPDAALAYSGVRHHYNRFSGGQIDGYPLQLVQVMHRLTDDRWIERDELVTDDLERMLWSRLRRKGSFLGVGEITCEWVDHPDQHHKAIRETTGGLNPYRARYGVRKPIRMQSSIGPFVDELERYRRFRERPDTPPSPGGLKILLVGELAYNPERVLALEERGHTLYGLWSPDPMWFNSVGPQPFGHVTDLDRRNWREQVRRIRPDVIYALLNWQALPHVHRIFTENPGIPFVWHFKEGPFICYDKGLWPALVELTRNSDGQIYCSDEMRDWFETAIPGSTDHEDVLVLDGDLPKQDWFEVPASPRRFDGEIHTVVPGRPIGLHPGHVAALAAQKIHLHFYGEYTHELWREWIDRTDRLARGYLHLHGNVDQDRWVKEFSGYDAGWLHVFRSQNGGDLRRANWDDLNVPARIPVLAAAGLPMLQLDNRGSRVAAQSVVRQLKLGVFFDDPEELGPKLRDGERMRAIRESVWSQRAEFTFDRHADRLVSFFHRVIERASRSSGRASA
jgi:hypothetical protein